MKIFRESIDRKHKYCKLEYITEHAEDICKLYDIIEPSDLILSSTSRKVSINNKDQQKIRLKLEIKVEKIEIDIEASILFLNGRTVEENEYVKSGSYHSLTVGIGDRLRIIKNNLNDITLRFIKEIKEPLCEILFLIEHKNDIEIIIFNNNFYKTLKRVKIKNIEKEINEINVKDIKLIVFINFKKHIKTAYKSITVDVPVNSDIINYCLRDNKISKQIENTQFYKNFRNMENFIKQQATDNNLISIGIKEIKESMEYAAIKSLIFSSNIIKTIEQKKEIERIVKDLKGQNAEIAIIPHTHPLGEKLETFGGIVATLKFQHRF